MMTGTTTRALATTIVIPLMVLCLLPGISRGKKLKPGAKLPSFKLATLKSGTSPQQEIDTDDFVGISASVKTNLLIIVFGGWQCKPCKMALKFLKDLTGKTDTRKWKLVVITEDAEKDDADRFSTYLEKELKVVAPIAQDVGGIVFRRMGCEKLPCIIASNQWGIVLGFWQQFDTEMKGQVERLILDVAPLEKPSSEKP